MKIKLVKTAKIECIKAKDLKVGDFILWANFKCKVVNIFSNGNQEKFAMIEQFLDEPESIMTIPKYSVFYKILESEIVEKDLE